LALAFLVAVAGFYEPRTGFTSLISFGGRFKDRRLSRLDDASVFTATGPGYDGQFYAQLAVAGNPFARELQTAVDSPAYRSRRILVPVLAHLTGWGQPAWVLTAYALANVVCWLLLGAALARWWFPPSDVHNLMRWIGTMFGAGAMVSVTRSLTDVPALLLVAGGIRCLELNRTHLGAIAIAAAGLVRETSVLSASAFIPSTTEELQRWPRAIRALAVCVLPIAVWMTVLTVHYGAVGGLRNFALPAVALAEKVSSLRAIWRAHGFDAVADEVWVVISIVVQAAFVISRPQPRSAWWRVGASFSVLALCLGSPVWEGSPSAAARALLPLSLAFNVLAPRARGGLVLIVLGNLTVLSAPSLAGDVPFDSDNLGRNVHAAYASGWHDREHLGSMRWRWSPGSAVLQLHNSNQTPVTVTLRFQMRSPLARSVRFTCRQLQETIALDADKMSAQHFGPIAIPPGDTTLTITSNESPWSESGPEGRQLSFALYDLRAVIDP
jgi:hypothetical protein